MLKKSVSKDISIRCDGRNGGTAPSPSQIDPTRRAPRQVDLREVLNTIRYLHRSGCQWDMLPHDLLPKSTVYDYFAQWRDDGTWTTVVTA